MRIRIETNSTVPAVRQIVEQIRVLLVEGSLKPGDALPSARRVAMELGVHFNTVAEAYRQLAEEDWLEIRHGRSARVKERAAVQAQASDRDSFRTRMRGLVAEMQSRGVDRARLASDLRMLAEEMGS